MRRSQAFGRLARATVFKHVLVVCVGNVCRSPVAEFLLRARLPSHSIQVTSAGLGALVGRPLEAHALALLHDHRIDASRHRARQLDRQMLREAELVLAMERRHLAASARLAPEASGKLFHIDKWLHGRDIPDPYRRSREVFDEVYERIERAVDSWLPYLSAPPATPLHLLDTLP